MVAALVLRSRNAIAAVVVSLLILGFLIFNHAAENPVVNIKLPEVKLPEALRGATGGDASKNTPPKSKIANPANGAKAFEAASNATLGFSKILYINMKHRWDKWDTAVLQAYTSGVDIEHFPAVEGKEEIEDAGRVGLPPSNGAPMGAGAIACYRSHANIWDEMVRKRSAPILILEADAAWDANIRGIMGLFNKHFLDYLVETDAKPTDAPPIHAQADPNRPKDRPVEFNPEDPWQSEFWDIISIGHCNDQQAFHQMAEKAYMDEFYAPPPIKNTMFAVREGNNRMLKRSHGFACTTGYAVSHRGAAKMLLRHAMNLNRPIDLIMGDMINEGSLISYTLNPPPIVQWAYRKDIGMSGAASSDLLRVDNAGSDKADKESDKSGWDDAMKKHSVWQHSEEKFPGINFKKPALESAWGTIFSDGAQFTMPEIAGVKKAVRDLEQEVAADAAKANRRRWF